MPKLLQINITSNWGSTGKIAEAINLAAQRKGGECSTAYGRWANPSKFPTYKVGNKWDMYVHYFENRIFDREGLSSRRATNALIRHIEELKPDVIGLHNIHDHYLNYELLFRYLNETNIKVVWTFHDCWAFTGHCFHFVTKDCMRWKTGCHDCPLHHLYPNTVLDRSVKNYALKKELFSANENLAIVACSDWLGDFVKESFLGDKRIEVIHNGVDLQMFRPYGVSDGFKEFQEVSDGKFKIIAVSSVWHPNKGELDIYKLRTMLPEDEYEITMVGLSAEQAKNLPEGTRGIQRTQNVQELAQLYSEADVLINPTYEDNFPTVNIEALACGTPVITYRTGGSPEAVRDEVSDGFKEFSFDSAQDKRQVSGGAELYNTGMVIEQGNVVALANAVMQMKDKPLSSADCRKRAEELFDKDKCFEKYVELYEDLLNSN